jgi:hypothetical protein
MTAKRELSKAFEHVSLPYGEEGRRMPGVLAPCGTCATKGQLVVNTIGGSGGNDDEIEWQFISRKLQQKGWRIGRRRGDHRCPRCLEVERLTKMGVPPASAFNQVNSKETMMSSTTVLPPKKLPAVADARPMTRDDKNIIYEKIKEVYLNDKVGYSDGWSDQRVASDLGVPRGWVATIRDEFFGDEITDQKTRERVKEAHELLAKIKVLVPAIEEARKLIGIADTMERELAQIAKVMK